MTVHVCGGYIMHADGPGYISLAYFKDFRMIKLYLLPGRWKR